MGTRGMATSRSSTIRCRGGGCGSSGSRSCSRSATSSPYPGLGELQRNAGLVVDGCLDAGERRHRSRASSRSTKRTPVSSCPRSPRNRRRGRWASGSSSIPARRATARMPAAATGFPNLRDNDWLYGGEPATIMTSITNGRMGVMPSFGGALGPEGVQGCRRLRALAVEASERRAAAPSWASRSSSRPAPRATAWMATATGRRRAESHRRGSGSTAAARRRLRRASTTDVTSAVSAEHPPMPAFKNTLGQGALGPRRSIWSRRTSGVCRTGRRRQMSRRCERMPPSALARADDVAASTVGSRSHAP